MTEQIQTNLAIARQALQNKRFEMALEHYTLVSKEDESIQEAQFFALFANIVSDDEKINRPDVFEQLCDVVIPAISEISESGMDIGTQKYLFISIVANFESMTWELYTKHRSASILRNGVGTLYRMGDSLEAQSKKPEFTTIYTLAVSVWKEAVSLQQKFYNMFGDKTRPERYAEKIKVEEPNYVLPEKAGCVSFGDKR